MRTGIWITMGIFFGTLWKSWTLALIYAIILLIIDLLREVNLKRTEK